jgi:hypothetical protein
MDIILDFQEKNLVDTPAPTHVKSWLRPCMHDIKLEKRMIMFLFKLIHNICHAHLFKFKVFFFCFLIC